MVGEQESLGIVVGIDWADEIHRVCELEVGTGKKREYALRNRPEDLVEWAGSLRERSGGRAVGVCVETTRGSLLSFLLCQEFVAIYPVNPASLKRFREAFCPSRAKDDPKDAEFLMLLLSRHRDQLRRWKPEGELTRELGLLTEARRKLVEDRVALSHRLKANLKTYYPLALEVLGGEVDTRMACDLLSRWPKHEKLAKAGRETLRKFFHEHHVRSEERIEERLERIESAVPLTRDRAIVEATALGVGVICAQMRVVIEGVEKYDEVIAERFSEHADAELFKSLPGAGPALAPRLMVVFGTDRERYESAAEVQTMTGIAPIVVRSGKSKDTRVRWLCPKFRRQTLVEFAWQSTKGSRWARAFYHQQREGGSGHQAALRALAFKWVRIIYRCWKERQPYDEERYIEALKKAGSPLAARIEREAMDLCG